MEVAVALLQQAGMEGGTGLEWMTTASVVVPAILLIILLYYGNKRVVR